MNTKHTPGPWSVAEELFDNDGIQERVIRGLDGRAAVAVTLDFGPNNPGMRDANARRIAACVNACAGVPTELLEEHPAPFSEMCAQRDELLVALELMLERIKEPPEANCSCHLSPPCADCVDYSGEREAFAEAYAAIAKAKGGDQ